MVWKIAQLPKMGHLKPDTKNSKNFMVPRSGYKCRQKKYIP